MKKMHFLSYELYGISKLFLDTFVYDCKNYNQRKIKLFLIRSIKINC